MTTHTEHETPDVGSKKILKRVLQLSFLFFLLKGIAWLAAGWLAWQGLT